MYKTPEYTKTTIKTETTLQGEYLFQKVQRVLANNEPIKADGISLIYTERKKGVLPETNVRTDRWEIATDAMGKVSASKLAKREEKFRIIENPNNGGETPSMAENQ